MVLIVNIKFERGQLQGSVWSKKKKYIQKFKIDDAKRFRTTDEVSNLVS